MQMYSNIEEVARATQAAQQPQRPPQPQPQPQPRVEQARPTPSGPRPQPKAKARKGGGLRERLAAFQGINFIDIDLGELVPDLGLFLLWSAMYVIGGWSFLLTIVQWGVIKVQTLDPLKLAGEAPVLCAAVALVYIWVTRTEQKYWFKTDDIGDFVQWLLVCLVDYFGIFFGVLLAFNNLNLTINGWGLVHNAWWTVVAAAVASFFIAFGSERNVIKYGGRVKEQLF